MARTTPSGIIALRGVSSTRAPILLVSIAGIGFYSSAEAVIYGGNTYVANRVKSIGSFDAEYIDRKISTSSNISIVLDNLNDSGTSAFTFTTIDASLNFEDRIVTVYAYSPDAGDALNVWWGFSGRPNFDGANKLVTINASHFWVSLDAPSPSKLAHQSGFNPTAVASTSNDNLSAESAIPLVWGVDNFKIRPLIYRTRVDGSVLRVNFIVSGTQSGAPFNTADVIAANVKLFNVTPASSVQFFTGGADSSVAPVNLTKFPDGVSHALVAYGYAEFPITNEQKDQIDNLQPDDIKMTIVNGRPLVDTTIPSENAALILKDFLRDPNFSIGLPNAIFDSAVLTSTANYVGTRYQVRYELHEQKSVAERVQQLLADFHGFITFDNGLIQIRCKKNSESSVATFATIDGGSGRKIHDDVIKSSYEKDASEVLNQVTVDYRLKKRNNRTTTLYDPNAQVRAGLTYKKVVEDKFELLGLFDETQVQINAAIVVREEQNGNLYIEFESPFWDCIDVSPGDIITVLSPDIPNNGSNYLFRVIGQSIDADSSYLVTFKCQVYKSAIYNDDASALGVDLLRGGSDTSQQGRPPDVVPVSLNIVDIVSNDTQGKTATLRPIWTYPTVDLTTEQAEGTFREYPIAQVDLFWHYTDESINAARLGASVVYPTAQADFQIDYYKSRSVRCFFVAVGHNRARSPLGFIPDPLKTTSLNGNLSATAAAAFVVSSASFAVNDLAFIEKELVKVVAVTGGGSPQLNFDPNSPPRTAYYDTVSIAHPDKTEISVAKLSYPSLTKSLAVPRFTYPAVSAINVRQRPDGVKVKITDVSAENVEDYFSYVSLTGDPGSGSATPAWYLADPLTPPVGITIISGKALRFTIPQEDIGAAGTVVYVRVAARNGKQNWSSALSPLASSAVGDDAVPVANQPRVVPKKHGFRVVEPMPTVNMKTFALSGKVEVVIQGKDGGGSSLGYLTDATGTDLTSTGSEYRFDLKLANSATYPISKESTLALWPTAVTLNVYVYVTNAVGTSAASTSRTVTVSTWEVGDMPTDTAVPSVSAAPTFARVKKNGTHLRMPLPTANRNSHSYNLVVVASASAPANGVKVLTASDLVTGTTLSSSDDTAGRIDSGRKKTTIEADKTQLETVFGVGVTIFFYFYAVNDVGTSSASSALSYNLATGETSSVTTDAQVPGGTGATLTAPTVSFEDGKLAIDFSVTGLTFMNTHLFNAVRLATLSETVPSFSITNAPNTSSPTTITTSSAHGYSVGQIVVISGETGNTAINGTWPIITVPSTTTFRIAVAGSGAFVGGGTVSLLGAFLNIPTKALVASGTTTKYQVHKSGHVIIGLKLRKLRDIFGPAAHIAVRYFITNSVGESQSAIADVNLATLTDILSETGLESGTGIPAKTLAINSVNVCPGGAFIASKDAYDVSGSTNIVGSEWRDKPNRSAGVRIDTTGTRGLKWLKATHNIEIATNVFSLGGELCCWVPIRPYLPGDTWALGLLLKTISGTYILNNFTMSLYDEGNAADITGTPVTISATDATPVILTTTYKTVGCVFQVGTGYVPGTSPRRQWLRMKFGEDPSVILYADNVMDNRGSQILPWGPALEDKGVASDVDPSGDTGSGGAGAGGGGGNGSGGGAGGGGILPGHGGGIEY